MSGTLLAELPEDRATGAIAEIYDEIRRFSGVPYVSSLQRYLATMPGVSWNGHGPRSGQRWCLESFRNRMAAGEQREPDAIAACFGR
jgi:hypothetical protein